jgi:hypothetical protein
MSNVKLVIPQFRPIPSIRVIDGFKLSREEILGQIFGDYRGNVVVLGDFPIGSLPVPSAAYLGNLGEGAIFNSVSTHVTKFNGKVYDVYKLWWKSDPLPVHYRSVETLTRTLFGTVDVLGLKLWGNETVAEALENRSDEYDRIKNAQLTFPILLTRVESRLVLLDGSHRLVKAVLKENTYIPVKIISRKTLSQCQITDYINDMEYSQRFV